MANRFIGIFLSSAALGLCTCSVGVSTDGGGETLSFQLSPDKRSVAIVDPQGFAELLELSRTEPRPRLQPLVAEYIRQFAEIYGNEANFVIFTLDAHRDDIRFNALGGFNVTVQADEQGIGPIRQLDDFERLPHLRSYTYLSRKDSLVLGPSLHELAHGWGVRLQQPSILGTQVIDSDNHWGFSGVGGQLGGWRPGTLEETEEGIFRTTSGNVNPNGRSFNDLAYATLELYLMGLASPDEIGPIQIAMSPMSRSLFEFQAEGLVDITIEDIIVGNGERIPSIGDAPSAFTIDFLILTDHELSDDEWQFYMDSVNYFSATKSLEIRDAFPEDRYGGHPILDLLDQADDQLGTRFINFFEATDGRATIEFLPLAPTLDSVGPSTDPG